MELSITYPLRQPRFFVFSSRDRIPEFLWGLVQTIPSLILLHVIIGYDYMPYQNALLAFVFRDFCVRALPGSLSLEILKPKMGLTSSLAPVFPTPCDHLSEHMLTPNGAIETQLSIFLLQGTLVPSIPETRKPSIIRIYGPDRRLDQWPRLNPNILPFGILAGSSLIFPRSPESLVALGLRHVSSTNGRSRLFRDPKC